MSKNKYIEDCIHVEYDADGPHCKIDACKGFQCRYRFGEDCGCYEPKKSTRYKIDFLEENVSDGTSDGFYENESVKKAINEFANALIEEFTKSASNQEFQQTKKILQDVCPMKVNKIKKRFLKNLGD